MLSMCSPSAVQLSMCLISTLRLCVTGIHTSCWGDIQQGAGPPNARLSSVGLAAAPHSGAILLFDVAYHFAARAVRCFHESGSSSLPMGGHT